MAWQALLDLGFLLAARDYIQTGKYRRRVLALAYTLDDPVSRGHSLNRVGNWHLFVDHPCEALRYHQEALELFRALNDELYAKPGHVLSPLSCRCSLPFPGQGRLLKCYAQD